MESTGTSQTAHPGDYILSAAQPDQKNLCRSVQTNGKIMMVSKIDASWSGSSRAGPKLLWSSQPTSHPAQLGRNVAWQERSHGIEGKEGHPAES
eukprot:3284653-Amphidinium_carterae.1